MARQLAYGGLGNSTGGAYSGKELAVPAADVRIATMPTIPTEPQLAPMWHRLHILMVLLHV